MAASLLYKVQTRWLFHAHVKLKLSVFVEDNLFDELFAVLEDVDAKYNSYTKGSYIYQINEHSGNFVPTDATTIELLKKLSRLSDDLDGEYDITVMPFIRLWGFYMESGHRPPLQAEIEALRDAVDYKSITIIDNTVRINQNQEIITGSFLKSFAVDRMVEKMIETGISDAIVNAGGSTIVAINNESHPFWQVQVNDTDGSSRELFTLRISNECYSTSSNEKTYLEIDGKRYGHIISPKTGYPSQNRQVGIISHNAFVGDVLSTGLFNLDQNAFSQKMAFLSEKYGVEGFLVDKDGEIIFSKKFSNYIVNGS